jgi:hypothetical protein
MTIGEFFNELSKKEFSNDYELVGVDGTLGEYVISSIVVKPETNRNGVKGQGRIGLFIRYKNG